MLRVSELVKVLKLKQLKEVFIVDGNLRITPVKILESVWEHKSKIFTAKIDSMPVIVLRGGWNKWTTYAAFETEQEAKDFKKAVKKYERRRLAEKSKKESISVSAKLS